jgi:hypothetical protein
MGRWRTARAGTAKIGWQAWTARRRRTRSRRRGVRRRRRLVRPLRCWLPTWYSCVANLLAPSIGRR